jgi:hypothetical protein
LINFLKGLERIYQNDTGWSPAGNRRQKTLKLFRSGGKWGLTGDAGKGGC